MEKPKLKSTKLPKLKLSIRDSCFIGVFTAFIAASAQLSIPAPTGVFTLQTFVIALAGIILGAKKGALSALVYVMVGAIGLPVFAGFKGGFGVVFGATGGYILSFPLLALCAGIGSDLYDKYDKYKNMRVRNILPASGLFIGAAINYICGMLMGKFIISCGWREAVAVFVLPYIFIDAVKMAMAWIVGLGVKKVLSKIYKNNF